jgi:hypothetical protein
MNTQWRITLFSRSIVWVAMLLLFSASALGAFFTALAPPIFWHTTDAALPADIQTLAAAPATLYAGTWGQGITLSDDHGATWITATTGLTLPMYVKGA